MRIGILASRIRAEEKLILAALDQRDVAYEVVDIRHTVFHRHSADRFRQFDVVLERCISHSRAVSALQILESQGVPVVNDAQVAQVCGSKLETTLALERANIPTPEVQIAFSPEAALEAIESMGYPVVLKPAVGSWGRLLAKINDREAAEAVLEHKATLGTYHHSVFYIQRYVDKPQRDLRTFVVGEETICGIARHAEHWITNTARAGQVENYVVTAEAERLSRAAARAVGGGILAIDLLETPDGELLVNEVNYTMEFRNSIAPTGVDIPHRIVDYLCEVAQRAAPAASDDVAIATTTAEEDSW